MYLWEKVSFILHVSVSLNNLTNDIKPKGANTTNGSYRRLQNPYEYWLTKPVINDIMTAIFVQLAIRANRSFLKGTVYFANGFNNNYFAPLLVSLVYAFYSSFVFLKPVVWTRRSGGMTSLIKRFRTVSWQKFFSTVSKYGNVVTRNGFKFKL